MSARALPTAMAGAMVIALTLLVSPRSDARAVARIDAPRAGAALETAAPTRWVVAPTGNEARYRVREQLAGLDFPNDAVGATGAITGAIVIDERGAIVRDQSQFVVDLRPLKSDRDRRDNYLQRRTLETETHPTVTLVPTAVRGLSPGSALTGEHTFELVADLTVKGVTRPTTWNVTARFDGDRVTGRAATAFTFDDFGLTKPRVASVLSVADTIGLEYDFALERK